MAVFHKSTNHLAAKAWFNFAMSIFLVLAGLFMIITLRPRSNGHINILFMFFFMVLANFYFQKGSILIAGVDGEKNAKLAIKKLPDTYHVFTNVNLKHENSECEIDLLVVGHNGVFAIEVKNHNGSISGDPNAETWEQGKTGREGGTYSKTFKNPIKQIKRSTYILSQFFKQKQINTWITPMVLFTNQPSGINVASKDVFTSGDVVNYVIQNTHPREPLDNKKIANINNLLTHETAKSKRGNFLSEVILTKSSALAVIQLIASLIIITLVASK